MADLPTNYFDDILSESMNGKKKFRLTYRNGTTEEVTIEDISEYDQYGSKFGAGDINKTNQAVNEKFDSGDVVDPMLTTEPGFAADAYRTKLQFDEQNKNLGGLRFGVDGDGNGGYYKADDSFVPFKSGLKLLWGNPSPTSAFSPQTIPLDLSNFDYVLIRLRFSFNQENLKGYGLVSKGSSKELIFTPNNSGTAYGFRRATVDDNGVTFTYGGYTGTTSADDDRYGIPLEIYGL